jgi:hypothetical protein
MDPSSELFDCVFSGILLAKNEQIKSVKQFKKQLMERYPEDLVDESIRYIAQTLNPRWMN